MTLAWRVAHSHGDAGAFHALDPAAQRSATLHTVDRATLVLGSAQHDDAVDLRVAATLGVDVVHRRSGGGAVLLLPGEFVWLDLVVPAADPLWSADVGRAMVWVGRLWQDALAQLAGAGGSHVHLGPLRSSEWSRAVCWAGVGAGELMHGEAKLVGVSQRRTRQWARFQSMCHLQWRPERVAALVAAPRPAASELAGAAACVAAPAADVVAALLANLPG